MILCDVGNTHATFFKDGKIWNMDISKFETYQPEEKIFFISVNDKLEKKLEGKNFINLEPYCHFDTTYQGLGIDRAMACYTIKTGLVIDAGSAITMDVMGAGMHLGGLILPGLTASAKAYEDISPRLKCIMNSQLDLDCLPQRTTDAVSYGILKPIISIANELASGNMIYLTGGDGAFLERFFENAIYNKGLVFSGMKQVINENKELLC